MMHGSLNHEKERGGPKDEYTVAVLIIGPLGPSFVGKTPEIALRFPAYFSHK
jgi:hypothetical protein